MAFFNRLLPLAYRRCAKWESRSRPATQTNSRRSGPSVLVSGLSTPTRSTNSIRHRWLVNALSNAIEEFHPLFSKTYETVVVGAGAAGVGCALSAAAEGASVLLLEKAAQLGGTVRHALIHTIA